MSLPQATMLVAGNMIGTGLFLLPVNLAQVGGIAIFGWVIATVGVAALGLVFAKLGELDPQQGGPYAYARDFLGPYAGFQTNYVYWAGNCIGNIAIAVAAVGYLAELIPSIHGPPASVVATALIIWVLTFLNILGPRVIGVTDQDDFCWSLDLHGRATPERSRRHKQCQRHDEQHCSDHSNLDDLTAVRRFLDRV